MPFQYSRLCVNTNAGNDSLMSCVSISLYLSKIYWVFMLNLIHVYHLSNTTCISNKYSITDCGLLPNITNGHVTVVEGIEGSSTYNATATYTCDAGYQLSHTVTRTCEVTGTWSNTQPSCVAGILYFN